ncbi:MAG: hypothetical protein JW850_07675 [Thermoflexales bacterium]|nr:hypothetical protein [Thermoflexales bacterium]
MSKTLKWGCGGLAALTVCLVVGIVLVSLAGGGTSSSGVSGSAAKASASVTPAPEAPTYAGIKAKIDGMTDAQRNAYLGGLKGYRVVNWSGKVCDVSEMAGSYLIHVSVDLENDSFLCTSEILWRLTKDEALQYQKDQSVSFSGVIDQVNELAGTFSFQLKDVAVHE